MFSNLNAQTTLSEDNFRAFDHAGNAIKIEQIIAALSPADVIFLGEQHDDPTGHHIEFEVLKSAFEKYGKTRSVVLSMEMFERDSQIVVDEYLQDLINESNFIAQSRAWNNYKNDYRPLIEFAKTSKIAVVAANAPRRYVNRVSRLGRESLDILSLEAKSWLAPLPYNQASEKYQAKFNALMSGMGGAGNHNVSKILDSQTLWDATMADSIAKALRKNKNALVVHLNGGFHSENRLGTVEQLLKYNPKTRVVVVTMKSADNFPNFDKTTDTDAGDFVILTNPKMPRSFKQN
jgi:uncharacterized iron-regulated protein